MIYNDFCRRSVESRHRLLSTEQEITPARYAIDAHEQYFMVTVALQLYCNAWFLAIGGLAELADGPSDCSEEARCGCSFA